MNKCNERRLIKRPMDDGRFKGRVGKRKRVPHVFRLVIHDLSSSDYSVHPYQSAPGWFAIRTSVAIELHSMLLYREVVYKVAAVSEIAPGCLEVKGLKWDRLQNRGPITT